MKIFIGCDHAAFEEKQELKTWLKGQGFDVVDMGTSGSERCDYPVYAKVVVGKILEDEKSCGILLCGSGVGMSMVANRYKKIRAALCRNVEDATLSKQHNNANVLCLGARTTSVAQLKKISKAWLDTSFEGGRHLERVDQFDSLGESM